MDPRLLYHFDTEVWSSLEGARPPLIHLLDGFIDAGSVGRQLAGFLLDNTQHEVLVEFDLDQLHDYRSRRPMMIFDTNQWVGINDFTLRIHAATDDVGQRFLLMNGPEPDTQWLRAARAVLGLSERLNVPMLVSAHGIPMAVPHTRPTLVTAHATDPALAGGNPVGIERVQVPASFSAMLELRAGQQGMTALGYVAHVPHYLTQSTFPQATAALLRRIMGATGLVFDLSELEESGRDRVAAVSAEVADDAEFLGAVAALEEQYDDVAPGQWVPTADEIGAEVERFLADQDKKAQD